jgi:hypothetical protein
MDWKLYFSCIETTIYSRFGHNNNVSQRISFDKIVGNSVIIDLFIHDLGYECAQIYEKLYSNIFIKRLPGRIWSSSISFILFLSGDDFKSLFENENQITHTLDNLRSEQAILELFLIGHPDVDSLALIGDGILFCIRYLCAVKMGKIDSNISGIYGNAEEVFSKLVERMSHTPLAFNPELTISDVRRLILG